MTSVAHQSLPWYTDEACPEGRTLGCHLLELSRGRSGTLRLGRLSCRHTRDCQLTRLATVIIRAARANLLVDNRIAPALSEPTHPQLTTVLITTDGDKQEQHHRHQPEYQPEEHCNSLKKLESDSNRDGA